MSAQVVVDQTAVGWNVHVTGASDVVIRTDGPRITVAVVPDDDTPPAQPLDVTLGEPAG